MLHYIKGLGEYPWTHHGTWTSACAYARSQSRKIGVTVTAINGENGKEIRYRNGSRV